MAAMIFKLPPQFAQWSMSISKNTLVLNLHVTFGAGCARNVVTYAAARDVSGNNSLNARIWTLPRQRFPAPGGGGAPG